MLADWPCRKLAGQVICESGHIFRCLCLVQAAEIDLHVVWHVQRTRSTTAGHQSQSTWWQWKVTSVVQGTSTAAMTHSVLWPVYSRDDSIHSRSRHATRPGYGSLRFTVPFPAVCFVAYLVLVPALSNRPSYESRLWSYKGGASYCVGSFCCPTSARTAALQWRCGCLCVCRVYLLCPNDWVGT